MSMSHFTERRPLTDICSPGTETAAQASAAFSACSLLYATNSSSSSLSPASLQNTTYSSLLLSHASTLNSFALNATGGRQTTQSSVPAIADAYGASSYEDDLALSALFLAWASNSTDQYKAAEGLYAEYGLSKDDGVFNWDGKAPGLPVLFAQMLKVAPAFAVNANTSMGGWQQLAESYFDGILNANGRGKLTKGTLRHPATAILQELIPSIILGGLLYYSGDSETASLNPALNAAMLMTRYAPLASSSQKSAAYLVGTFSTAPSLFRLLTVQS